MARYHLKYVKDYIGPITHDTETEMTDLTVSWSDLSASGFSGGETCLIIVQGGVQLDTTSFSVRSKVEYGSSYATRTTVPGSYRSVEGIQATAYVGNWMVIAEVTLSANDNIYVTGWATNTSGNYEPRFHDYSMLIIDTASMSSSDLQYNITTPGTAPTTWTTGGSVSGGNSGNWLFFANAQFDVNNINDDMFVRLNDGTTQVQAYHAGDDTTGQDTENFGVVWYYKSSTGNVDCQFKTESGLNTVNYSSVAGINLDAFVDDGITVYDDLNNVTVDGTANTWEEAFSQASVAAGDYWYIAFANMEYSAQTGSRFRVLDDAVSLDTNSKYNRENKAASTSLVTGKNCIVPFTVPADSTISVQHYAQAGADVTIESVGVVMFAVPTSEAAAGGGGGGGSIIVKGRRRGKGGGGANGSKGGGGRSKGRQVSRWDRRRRRL